MATEKHSTSIDLAPGGQMPAVAYANQQLDWYTRNTRTARIGYFSLELLALSFAAAVPVATAAGASAWVVAALGSAAAAAVSARHIFGFDRNWTARAVTAERIKGRLALFESGQIDPAQLVNDITDLVDRETAGWSHAVRSSSRSDEETAAAEIDQLRPRATPTPTYTDQDSSQAGISSPPATSKRSAGS